MSSKIPKKPIPKDFELSDKEPAVVNLNTRCCQSE